MIVWKNGQLLTKEETLVDVTTHALHYGTSVFEGIRAYNTPKGTAVLALKEHMQRFMYSMSVLNMPCKFSLDELCQAVVDTVKKSGLDSCYIRPLAYFGTGAVAVLPKEGHPVDIVIYCLPMGRYLGADMVDVKISKYIRIHPNSTVCDAKIGGHYINSLLASSECIGTHYHESILLDANGNVAEAAAMNIFIVKDNIVKTTPLGTILKGITRKIIIRILKDAGYTVKEELFKPSELMEADEAFLCGTAAEVTPIASVNDIKISNEIGEVVTKVQEAFEKVKKAELYPEIFTFIN